jgi:CheY-like chemotaxis protein
VEKRILLVEDDASFREVFTRALGMALASEHFDVSFVEAGTLAAARSPQPACGSRRAAWTPR